MQIIKVSSNTQGIQKAADILYQNVNSDTALFLSGGKTPQGLYEKLTSEKKLRPGAVGMIDERFGQPLHDGSNEKMLYDSGLLDYLQKEKILFYPMLQDYHSRVDAAIEYDQEFLSLVWRFKQKIAIMGIGADGHTASMIPNRPDFKNPIFDLREVSLVSSFNDASGPYSARITLTFQGLSLMDKFIILVLGSEKKETLAKMFKKGSEQEIPARFFLRKQISQKCILITDQKVQAQSS